jgi:hypothetical protein
MLNEVNTFYFKGQFKGYYKNEWEKYGILFKE